MKWFVAYSPDYGGGMWGVFKGGFCHNYYDKDEKYLAEKERDRLNRLDDAETQETYGHD